MCTRNRLPAFLNSNTDIEIVNVQYDEGDNCESDTNEDDVNDECVGQEQVDDDVSVAVNLKRSKALLACKMAAQVAHDMPPTSVSNGNVSALKKLPIPRYYRYILTFIYAIDEINQNPGLLPNITLGYHATDSCNCVRKAVESTLQIISGPGETVPNFSCLDHDKLAGFIGDFSSEKSLHIAEILNLYGYTQISYGATDPILTNKKIYPSFFQTLPSDQTQYLVIIKLLRQFGWTWIGVVTSDDDDGEMQSQELQKVSSLHGVCIEYIIKVAAEFEQITPRKAEKSRQVFNKSTSHVVVLCGTVSFSIIYFIEKQCTGGQEKTFILPASVNVHTILSAKWKAFLHGGFAFSTPTKQIPKLKRFLEEISRTNRPNDILLEHILASYKDCLTSESLLNRIITNEYKIKLHKCNNSVQLRNLGNLIYYTQSFGIAYQIYKAVYAIAHSLHEMHLYAPSNHKESFRKNLKYMHKYMLRLNFQDPTGEEIYFNDKGEMTTFYYINNYAVISAKRFSIRKVGQCNSTSPEGEKVTEPETIFWKHGQVPVSICSQDCPLGFRRGSKRGFHQCCFKCVQCSEGEISNNTDKTSCQKCPEDHWPDDKYQCVQKPTEFLSYMDDPTALIISIISMLLFIKTSIILVIFILFRDSPIIKANNQHLSFLLLVSIMLSFLCVLLFLGRPVHITCMLRQTSFGIIFSVAISCILAKTILVYLAFTATKPGSSWRKFIGVKITNCVVFICSFIQVLISIIWLCVSPPFPECNRYTFRDKIIIQCNEGSILAFSILLGYMGLLTAVSFIAAFLARNLPDSFNEAKYITFSMLVFCSVWVTFIPAYMSVTGKSTVLVEIFAIMSSSIGILGCIFYPKCYIILVRQELNTKNNLLIRKSLQTFS
ncbi:vomeronasal type-2 receptor 26-like [Pseudophryne corroboree]|uniref:vomeronasal type-2 receptor 26-like n=1 Tax=Pseudophryne corroboree TaxID=495146 RepID=UPI0030815E7D